MSVVEVLRSTNGVLNGRTCRKLMSAGAEQAPAETSDVSGVHDHVGT